MLLTDMDKNREKMYIHEVCMRNGESMRYFATIISGGG